MDWTIYEMSLLQEEEIEDRLSSDRAGVTFGRDDVIIILMPDF